MMKYRVLSAVFLAAIAIALPIVAQRENTDNPDVFLAGKARSCQGCNLRDQNLSKVRDGKHNGAQLRFALLNNANLSNSNFRGAYFTCADLRGANLSGTNFSYANFVDANLSGTDLRNADLSKTDLSGANLDGAKLDGANLDGAKLWDAKTLYTPNVDLSKIQQNLGMQRQRQGGCPGAVVSP